MTTIKIDPKTSIMVPDGQDPEAARQRFIERLNESREKRMRTRIPYISD
jgi:hypothetical protein